MKITFATYKHSTIGFPGVVLKWSVQDGKMGDSYVTVKGIIQAGAWHWYNPYPLPMLDYECERFDDWVRERFSNDASVQG